MTDRDERRAWLSRASYRAGVKEADPSLGVAIRAELVASERDREELEKARSCVECDQSLSPYCKWCS